MLVGVAAGGRASNGGCASGSAVISDGRGGCGASDSDGCANSDVGLSVIAVAIIVVLLAGVVVETILVVEVVLLSVVLAVMANV